MFTPRPTSKKRARISITQGGQKSSGFRLGYQSFVTDSRTPTDALSDMTNVTLDQDNLPRPRPSFILHGEQPLGTMLGVNTFIKIVSGVPEKWDISMQVISGVGKVHVRKDGDTWVAATGTNSYSATAIVNFCQSGNRVYISNGVDEMSYYNINTGAMVVYATLSTPSAPTPTGTGLTGTTFKYYYRISANSTVGESTASTAGTVDVSTDRDLWAPATQFVTVVWNRVTGAASYNIYASTVAGSEQYIASVADSGAATTTFKDDGSIVANPFKIAPSGNSTAGPKLKYMTNKDGQLFGLGDTDNPDYLWYDGGSSANAVGDFTAFNGGGNVGINSGGDTVPVAVKAFRTGKGDPVVSVLSDGVGGNGRMHHVAFVQSTFDGYQFFIPSVQEASGLSGTTSACSVVDSNNSLWYLTAQGFRSTGTSPNVQNILSIATVSNDILDDIRKINKLNMHKVCGLVYEGDIYWSLPVGSTENNQIWIKALSRKGIWIMPWTVTAKFMWLSEDNTSGEVSFCIYDGTNILKMTRSVATSDNGTPFYTRVAHEGLTWTDDGMSMGAIQNQRFKLLYPSGTVNVNAFGLDEDGAVNTLATDGFTQTASFTGWGQFNWGVDQWSGDVGVINYTTKQIATVNLEIDETLNQLGWEITSNTAGVDYYLSSVLTTGVLIKDSYYGD